MVYAVGADSFRVLHCTAASIALDLYHTAISSMQLHIHAAIAISCLHIALLWIWIIFVCFWTIFSVYAYLCLFLLYSQQLSTIYFFVKHAEISRSALCVCVCVCSVNISQNIDRRRAKSSPRLWKNGTGQTNRKEIEWKMNLEQHNNEDTIIIVLVPHLQCIYYYYYYGVFNSTYTILLNSAQLCWMGYDNTKMNFSIFLICCFCGGRC